MAICASCGRETPDGFPRCAYCGATLDAPSPASEQRKTVSIVFCDIADSTALGESIDPEALRALLARYFERMKRIVELHAGSVEKFMGDAVMAVFGVPVAHEDDALRACRAAVEMRDALPELGIRGRVGVNTGEVVTGTEERRALAIWERKGCLPCADRIRRQIASRGERSRATLEQGNPLP